MMKRVTRLAVVLAALTLTAGAPAVAQEPSPSPVASLAADACSLLTADEVSTALGQPVAPNALSPDACTFGDPTAASLTGLTLARVSGPDATAVLDQARTLAPAEIVVAGAPAHQTAPETLDSGLVRSQLIVATGADSVFILSADAPEGIDVAAAVLSLAELAVPRLGPITPPPLSSPSALSSPAASAAPTSPEPSVPVPSPEARTGLAALFPSTIGGSPVTVDVQTGREFLSQVVNFRPMEQRVTRALRRRDLGVGDLSFAQGTSPNSIILAFQVEGGRIAPLVSVLLEALSMERTGEEPRPEDVAGKEGVFEILSGTQGYAYVSGDTLWIVFSFGAEQVEIFEQLP